MTPRGQGLTTEEAGPEGGVAVHQLLKRRPERRDQILAVAVELFHERGFHATAMGDIGQRAGITGPGVYRHFKDKEEILSSAIAKGLDRLLAQVSDIVRSGDDPTSTLENLARNYARTVLEGPALTAMVVTQRHLLDQESRSLYDRAIRLHFDEWVYALSLLRPELSDGETRVRVHGAWGLLNSAGEFRSGLPPTAVENVLVEMTMAALVGAR